MSATSKTVKVRPPIAAKERGPGPGRYSLPSTFGKVSNDKTKKSNPSYSFGTKLPSSIIKKTCTPGPSYVDPKMSRTGTTVGRASSMGTRPKQLVQSETPAPGAYAPEKVHPQRERRAPAYSIGGRIAPRKKDNNPSPGTYTVPSLIGNKTTKNAAPSYTMAGRSNRGGFADDTKQTPGPGSYNNNMNDKKKAPAYSMTGRTFMPSDSTQKPGPGAHSPEKVNIHKKSAPSHSMGVRHSEYTTPLIVEFTE